MFNFGLKCAGCVVTCLEVSFAVQPLRCARSQDLVNLNMINIVLVMMSLVLLSRLKLARNLYSVREISFTQSVLSRLNENCSRTGFSVYSVPGSRIDNLSLTLLELECELGFGPRV